MNQNRKNKTSGDILEMMMQAGLRPMSVAKQEHRKPIVSINGKDVDLEREQLSLEAREKEAA